MSAIINVGGPGRFKGRLYPVFLPRHAIQNKADSISSDGMSSKQHLVSWESQLNIFGRIGKSQGN